MAIRLWSWSSRRKEGRTPVLDSRCRSVTQIHGCSKGTTGNWRFGTQGRYRPRKAPSSPCRRFQALPAEIGADPAPRVAGPSLARLRVARAFEAEGGRCEHQADRADHGDVQPPIDRRQSIVDVRGDVPGVVNVARSQDGCGCSQAEGEERKQAVLSPGKD